MFTVLSTLIMLFIELCLDFGTWCHWCGSLLLRQNHNRLDNYVINLITLQKLSGANWILK